MFPHPLIREPVVIASWSPALRTIRLSSVLVVKFFIVICECYLHASNQAYIYSKPPYVKKQGVICRMWITYFRRCVTTAYHLCCFHMVKKTVRPKRVSEKYSIGAKKQWVGLSPEERSRRMSILAKTRWAKTTKKQRVAFAKKIRSSKA